MIESVNLLEKRIDEFEGEKNSHDFNKIECLINKYLEDCEYSNLPEKEIIKVRIHNCGKLLHSKFSTDDNDGGISLPPCTDVNMVSPPNLSPISKPFSEDGSVEPTPDSASQTPIPQSDDVLADPSSQKSNEPTHGSKIMDASPLNGSVVPTPTQDLVSPTPSPQPPDDVLADPSSQRSNESTNEPTPDEQRKIKNLNMKLKNTNNVCGYNSLVQALLKSDHFLAMLTELDLTSREEKIEQVQSQLEWLKLDLVNAKDKTSDEHLSLHNEIIALEDQLYTDQIFCFIQSLINGKFNVVDEFQSLLGSKHASLIEKGPSGSTIQQDVSEILQILLESCPPLRELTKFRQVKKIKCQSCHKSREVIGKKEYDTQLILPVNGTSINAMIQKATAVSHIEVDCECGKSISNDGKIKDHAGVLDYRDD